MLARASPANAMPSSSPPLRHLATLSNSRDDLRPVHAQSTSTAAARLSEPTQRAAERAAGPGSRHAHRGGVAGSRPLDSRAGLDTALARVVTVFGDTHPHHAYLFANRRPIA